jgi:hypothetical protein
MRRTRIVAAMVAFVLTFAALVGITTATTPPAQASGGWPVTTADVTPQNLTTTPDGSVIASGCQEQAQATTPRPRDVIRYSPSGAVTAGLATRPNTWTFGCSYHAIVGRNGTIFMLRADSTPVQRCAGVLQLVSLISSANRFCSSLQ